MVTTRDNVIYKINDEDDGILANEGFFFLRRTSKNDFAAMWRFTADDIKIFEDPKSDSQGQFDTSNIAAIRLSESQMVQKEDLGDLPEFEYVESDSLKNDLYYSITGYPKVVIGKNEQGDIE